MSRTYFLHDRKISGDIAIVGMATHFPDAPNLYKFWENIIGKKDSLIDITEVSKEEYWKKDDFYHPDPAAADKTYSYRAGFVPAIDFDPVEFKIPPAILDSLSTAQLFALYVAKQAMEDAGLLAHQNSKVNRDHIGVILGGGGNGNTSFSLAARQQAPYLREIMMKSGLSAEVADDIIERAHGMYLEWNEDSFPGFLGNVACGRIASYFDLGGTSYMVDAACASSLAAIKAAIGELQSGSCDAVLTGGVNLENSVFSFLCFSKTPALSINNLSRPFDQSADGMMLGDGVGMLVLKRLEDAELDGDKIYAVIKSVEASSDGRAKSIFAPRLEGQVKALKRAYASAGIMPGDIQLVEAHGTGTASGDDTELKSLHAVFGECSLPPKSVAIGSIKSQIGHTRCAAGAASMIKVALALHHKVLPPTINVEKPTDLLLSETTPFYINSEARPWLRSTGDAPRRAALSAFGFGGTNFHAILEEYKRQTNGRYRLNESPWIMLFKGENPAELLSQCEAALSCFSAGSAENAIRRHLEQQDIDNLQPHQARILFVSQTAEQTAELLSVAIRQLQNNTASGWEHPRGIYYQPEAKALDGRIVALFPGQGSQYINMAREIANDYPEMRQALEALDDVAISESAHTLSPLIYPVPAFSEDEYTKQQQRLTDTANAQPALGAVSAGYFDILKNRGFRPDFVAGHSYGEVTALWAAGVLSGKDFYRVSFARGRTAASASQRNGAGSDAGAMLAASLNHAQREKILQRYAEIIIANDNSEQQVVFGGATSQINRLYDELKKQGIHCRILPVSAAFHTQFIQPAYQPYREFLTDINFQLPECRLFSSATAEPYGNSSGMIRELLAEQLIKPVKFRQTIEAIYQQGGRLFIEFGPKGILGKLVSDILKTREHTVISVNPSDKGEERLQLARAQARLLAEGVSLRDINQHVRTPPVEDNGNKRLTFRLSGGFFLSEKNKARRQHALRDGDHTAVEKFIASLSPLPTESLPETGSLPETDSIQQNELTIIQKRDNPMEQNNKMSENRTADTLSGDTLNGDTLNGDTLNGLLQAQQVMSQLHQQFQTNQQEYIQLLRMLLENQYSLLENCRDHQNLPAMLSSLSQSVQLLDKNLELYHTNHERYFMTQQSLFQPGQAAPVMSAINRPTQPVAEYSAPRSVPIKAVPTKVAPVSAVEPISPVSVAVPDFQPTEKREEVAAVRPVIPAPAKMEVSAQERKIDPETEKLIKRLEQITEENIISQLLNIVSEKTGYPPEMISPEMDLEADLGIDSIKRLEIFGAMFDVFSANLELYGETSRNKDIENFEVDSLSTLAKMSGFFKQMVDEAISALYHKESDHNKSQSESGQASPSPLPSIEKSHAESYVTGNRAFENQYSPLGFVTSTMSPAVGNDVKKPLAESQQEITSAVQPELNHGLVLNKEGRDKLFLNSPVSRFAVVKQMLPMTESLQSVFSSPKRWLVVDEGTTSVNAVVETLNNLGQQVVVMSLWRDQAAMGNESALNAALSDIKQQYGDIEGVIYLQAAKQAVKTLTEVFNERDYRSVETVFLLAKCLQSSLTRDGKLPGYFMVIMRGDGELLTSGREYLPIVSAGITGLTKSLNIEWSNVFCRTVDIDVSVSDNDVARMVIEELQDSRTDVAEIGRGVNGERMTLALTEEKALPAAPDMRVSNRDVLVVTGGARGITAHCVIELAKQSRAAFVLLGRTDITAPLPAWSAGKTTLTERRAAAIDYLKSQGIQPTPVKVSSMLNPLIHIDEINATVEAIRQTGSRAIYLHCDITVPEQVKAALEKAQRPFGPITGLIHGAGNLADKRIEKKTLADLHSVFHSKVRGLENMCRGLDCENLRHIILFSSVSGFFGNAGQTDYSLANEVLNKFVWLPFKCNNKENRQVVRSVNWGPWDGGMVSDVLKRAYEAQNMVIIPLEEGTQRFVSEFCDVRSRQITIGGKTYMAPKKTKLNNKK